MAMRTGAVEETARALGMTAEEMYSALFAVYQFLEIEFPLVTDEHGRRLIPEASQIRCEDEQDGAFSIRIGDGFKVGFVIRAEGGHISSFWRTGSEITDYNHPFAVTSSAEVRFCDTVGEGTPSAFGNLGNWTSGPIHL